MEDFDKSKVFRLKKANILIAPEKTKVIAYISGKSPIMTTNYKNAVAQSLNCKLNDVFDVISYQNGGEATFVRDCLLFYAKYSELYENLKCLESGKAEKGAIYTIGTNLDRVIDMCKENVGLQTFETALTESKKNF